MDGLSCSVTVGDAPAIEVVRRQFHLDHVARKNPDVVLAHLPGDRRQDVVATVELDPEHGAWKRFGDFALDLDLLFLARHPLSSGQKVRLDAARSHGTSTGAVFVRTRGPSIVIATVCSK